MRRYIIIILAIVVIAAIAIAIIFFLKGGAGSSPFGGGLGGGGGSLPNPGIQSGGGGTGGNGSTTGTGGNSGGTGGSGIGPGSPIQSFGVVAAGPVLDYFVSANNVVTVAKADGTVISISAGASSTLSATTTPNVISASFSYDGKKVLFVSGDPSNPQSQVFDTVAKTWTTLPQGMLSPQWSPSTYQIAYLSEAVPSKTVLSMLDAANLKKGPAAIYSLRATDLTLQWVDKNHFLFSDKPSSAANGSLWMYDAQQGSLTPIAYENPGAESTWGAGPTSTLGMVLESGSQGPLLQLVNPAGSAYHALALATLPSKCEFGLQQSTASASSSTASSTAGGASSTASLYCGIPRNAAQFASRGFLDEYNMMALFTSDQIVRVDLSTGNETTLWNDATQNMDVSDIRFFNNDVFFVNRYDQNLYGLILSSS